MSDHYWKNWQHRYDEDDEKIIIYVEHPPQGFGICPLAELTTGGPDDMSFDDDMKRAAMMAAAPDLLEACKEALEIVAGERIYYDAIPPTEPLKVSLYRSIQASEKGLITAIDKATT